MGRFITLGCLFFVFAFAKAQDFSDNWTGFFSYNNIVDVSLGDGVLYAGAENAVFAYDTQTAEIGTFSTITGLSGRDISTVYYSEAFGILFIGYTNGIIDIVRDGEEDVIAVVDILNKPSIAPSVKSINHFMEFEGVLYISTGFGISLYELDTLEFDDSYFIGDNGAQLNITQTAVLGDFIYAATTTAGIRRALVAANNLIDFDNWDQVQGGNWQGIITVGDVLAATDGNNLLYRSDGTNFANIANLGAPVQDLRTTSDGFLVTTRNAVRNYDSGFNLLETIGSNTEFPSDYAAAVMDGPSVFAGTRGSGVLVYGSNVTLENQQILPDGPLLNSSFAIEALPGELWAAFGDYNVDYNPFPLKRRGLSHFQGEGEGWFNYTYQEVLNTNNMVNITLDQENPQLVYVSSYNSGLLEISEGIPTILYDETNSALSDIPINPTDVRINGAAYDREGNLWMTNSQVENALVRKTRGNDFQGFSIVEVIPDFDGENGYGPLVIDRSDNIYFGSSNSGLIGYQPSTNTFERVSGDDGEANLPVDDVRALALDNRGTLWIGTTRGLRILFGPSAMFTETVSTNPIIILQDGIPAELLNDISITDIVVDGSNNKWVATASSGVFYFSPNGQETLLQFNADNSPLPDDSVQDISIDGSDGTVYFATDRGLVAFRGSATAPAEDLTDVHAFPNPVRPGFSGAVTIDGLTSRSNVKITDIEGNLVFEQVAEGGSIQWDTTAFGRYKVASGVYLIIVTSDDATETKVSKLMIVR